MTVDERSKTALSTYVSEIQPNIYKGTSLEYIVYNYHEYGDCYAESAPGEYRCMVQVHWYLPHGVNPNTKKKQIRNALIAAGFAYRSTVNASDKDSQHYTFECVAVEKAGAS